MQITKDILQFGDIILIQYPSKKVQPSSKKPFLVLEEDQHNVLVCVISSRIDHQEKQDLLIKKNNKNQLATSSLIKSKKLFTTHKSLIYKKLGTLSNADKQMVKDQLIGLMKQL